MTGQEAPVTLQTLISKKAAGEKIVFTTAYASWQARLADRAGIDGLVVGDSAAHVELGFQSTVPCKVSDLLPRLTSCWRATKRCLLVGDLPFGSYEASNEQAVRTAVEFIQHGASIVKLEGPCYARAEAIASAGILVMGHVGLTPQSRARFGGYRVQGKTAVEALKIVEEAKRLAWTCSLLLIEAVPAEVGKLVAESVSVPVIGVGAGPHVAGQTVIAHDLLGLFEDFRPKFARRYLEGSKLIEGALAGYAGDVRAGRFPSKENEYSMAEGEAEKLLEARG